MVRGCFWAGGFGPLVCREGSIDQDADALSNNMMPWLTKLGEDEDTDFIFQEDDGASRYTTWKGTYSIRHFDFWPPTKP